MTEIKLKETRGVTKMTTEQIKEKIKAIDIHVNLLKERGETMNARIINKWLRKRRALEAQL